MSAGGVEDARARAFRLFEQALALDPPGRLAFLDARCAGEPALRATVEALLADEQALAADAGLLLAPLPADPARFLGRVLGRFRAVAVIGQGVGAVFRAERTDEIGQTVALKVLLGGGLTVTRGRRFTREMKTLARLEHPAVARLIDAGVAEDGTPWLAMELVAGGEPIDAYCEARATPLRERVRLLAELADAVALAHRMLVVHRDIKPSNVLMSRDGAPKLIDFGIARLLDDRGEAPTLTVETGAQFTPQYAPPEQVSGAPASVATDVFGLGALAYRLLTGRTLFPEAASPLGYMVAVTQRDPPPASRAARERGMAADANLLYGDLESVLARALPREPARRRARLEHQVGEELPRRRCGRRLRAHPRLPPGGARGVRCEPWRQGPLRGRRAHRQAGRGHGGAWAGGASLAARPDLLLPSTGGHSLKGEARMRRRVLSQLFPGKDHSHRSGVLSVCCSHPLAIETGLRQAREFGEPLVVEATCNQVNQEGGYTGMAPEGFRRMVEGLAARAGLPRADLVLGGDHLGPNPWRHLPAGEAMARAEALVAAFVRAGFTKIHLDTSMACQGEGPALPEEQIARRAARLARVAQAAASPEAPLSYVIGTEVPVPGGTTDAPDAHHVTAPEAALRTVELHRQAFDALGLQAAFERVIGLVVQPGVEFGSEAVVVYDRARAAPLRAVLPRLPRLSFEAHSTDHQPAAALAALVEDGFALMKIGPMLTFAMREALYALDQVAEVLFRVPEPESLRGAMERLMVREPRHWAGYYHGTPEEQRVLRHFGLSDRIRYYWPHPEASAAVERLLRRFEGRAIPAALLSQFFPALHLEIQEGRRRAAPLDLVLATMERAFRPFQAPCAAAPAAG